jgi:Transglycosylase SLT domain
MAMGLAREARATAGGARGALAVGVAAAVLLVLLLTLLFSFVAVSLGGQPGLGNVCRLNGGQAGEVPARYAAIYVVAAERYRLGGRGVSMLASIHRTESGFGSNMEPSSAGAIGHMQFMPGTWAAYGVDANDDGKRDPFDAEDAIHAAARYLAASGAPRDWYRALFAYNHADWYVQEILAGARGYQGVCDQPADLPAELGELPADPVERIRYVARWIESRKLPYCWGGGHGPQPGPSGGSYCWNATGRRTFGSTATGLDCSGAVRWLLVLAGYPDPGGLVSDQLGAQYPAGPGRHVTIWSNPGHIFITIDGRGWGTSSSNHAHGPGFAEHATAGFVASHPPGL